MSNECSHFWKAWKEVDLGEKIGNSIGELIGLQ